MIKSIRHIINGFLNRTGEVSYTSKCSFLGRIKSAIISIMRLCKRGDPYSIKPGMKPAFIKADELLGKVNRLLPNEEIKHLKFNPFQKMMKDNYHSDPRFKDSIAPNGYAFVIDHNYLPKGLEDLYKQSLKEEDGF